MKNKKLTFVIVIISILLAAVSINMNINKTTTSNKNLTKETKKTNYTETLENNEIEKEEENASKEEIKEEKEEEKEEKKEETKKENNKSTNEKKPTENQTNKPQQVTYSCPDNYTRNGTTCTSTIDATYTCPGNTLDYSNENIPSNKYCINLSEGYESETTSCPDNYGIIARVSLGAPTVYKCVPLHEKIYTCPDGYNLDGSHCTRTVEATRN